MCILNVINVFGMHRIFFWQHWHVEHYHKYNHWDTDRQYIYNVITSTVNTLHIRYFYCVIPDRARCFLKEKNNLDIGRIVSVWLHGFKSCASCSSINISSALHPRQVNNIHEKYLYSAAHYHQSTELHVTQWCILSDFNWHSEKPQMVTQLGHCHHMVSSVEHQCHTKVVLVTVSNITHTGWIYSGIFNSTVTFNIFSTNIWPLILTPLYIKGDILWDA